MTIHDLRCDWCGSALAGPEGGPPAPGRRGVRFAYHPGSPDLRDDSGMLCQACWAEMSEWLGEPGGTECALCGASLEAGRLLVGRPTDPRPWRLCRDHAVELLNRMRTVEPKLDPASFALPEPRPQHE